MVREQSFRDLLRARKANRFTNWIGEEAESATRRLQSGEFLKVGVLPKFRLRRDSRVLTIGSCFARNIEAKLSAAGMQLASDDFSLPPNSYLARGNPKSALNKYNAHSIESEFQSALGRLSAPHMGLVQIGEDEWWDPLATHTKPDHFEAVAEIRRRINAVTARVEGCDAVVITLGLNEVWLDRETGVYCNVMPPQALVRKAGDRFAVIIADLEENMASLERTVSAIREVGRHTKIIITVSPVPMQATLTSMDVIVANTLSKSMLRVAAQSLADRHDYVDYFPSYEMVMNSPPHLSWQADRLHVTETAVDFVTSYFIQQYVEN